LLDALRLWGALDKNYEYQQGDLTSDRRGYEVDAGGGLAPPPVPSKPIDPSELLKSGLWKRLVSGANYEFQTTMFQPVGGMGMIGKAFARELGPNIIRYNSKVTVIKQNDQGVTVTYRDTQGSGAPLQAHADYCICTIPLPILSQIDIDVGAPMKRAIDALSSYVSSIKIGLQFKRRFWEQDEAIYGGISYTDLPIGEISYPSTNYGSRIRSETATATNLAPYRLLKGSKGRSTMEHRSTHSTKRNSRPGSLWRGIGCHLHWAA
jgi:monoamine oxidase